MLSRLIQFALTQRLLMLLAVVLFIGSGFMALRQIPIDAFPDISSTQVKIIIKAPGMTPEEVESRITAPIEVEMLGIPHQVMLRSVAKYALTDSTVDFAEGTDIFWARQQVYERLTGLWGDLPVDITGGIAPMTTPLGEMFMFTVEGGDLSLMERRNLLDWVIRPALRTVPGVADVNSLGGEVRSFEVVPDDQRMNARGVAMADLLTALEENNRNDGAGRLHEGEEALLVRAEGSIRTLDDVGAIVVKRYGNVPVRISDVATIRIGALTRYGAVTRNGEGEAVEGLVLGLRGANAQVGQRQGVARVGGHGTLERLLGRGGVSFEQLEEALLKQNKSKEKQCQARPLGLLLIEMGYIDVRGYLTALSKHFNIPIVNLKIFDPSCHLQNRIGTRYAMERRIIVLEDNSEIIKLVLAEPAIETMEELQKAIPPGKKIEFYLASHTTINECFLKMSEPMST